MANLTTEEFLIKNEKAMRYRWEFLRRNKLYAKDCKDFIKKKKELFSDPKKFKSAFQWLTKACENFYQCWGLSMRPGFIPPSPRKAFDALTRGEKELILPYATNPAWVTIKTMGELMNSRKRKNLRLDLELISSLKISIDLHMPMKRIKTEINYMLQIMKDLRKDRGLKDISKPNYECYKDYLKIYDLMEKKKMTYKGIYKKLHKDIDENEITREHESMIAKEYKQAEALVDFKYRNIW